MAIVEEERSRAPDAAVEVTRGRLTRRRLHGFVAARRSHEPTLVVHSHDVDHAALFPNRRHLSPRARRPEDLRAEPPYAEELAAEPVDHWPIVLCTGLLEHVPNPAATVRALARTLAPGGEVILSASAVFPFHGAPHNYFHFAPGGLRSIVEDASLQVVELIGSTGPFETLGVLSRRIGSHCGVAPPTRLMLEGLGRLLPMLDFLAARGRPIAGASDDAAAGVMPASLFVRAVKAGRKRTC